MAAEQLLAHCSFTSSCLVGQHCVMSAWVLPPVHTPPLPGQPVWCCIAILVKPPSCRMQLLLFVMLPGTTVKWFFHLDFAVPSLSSVGSDHVVPPSLCQIVFSQRGKRIRPLVLPVFVWGLSVPNCVDLCGWMCVYVHMCCSHVHVCMCLWPICTQPCSWLVLEAWSCSSISLLGYRIWQILKVITIPLGQCPLQIG